MLIYYDYFLTFPSEVKFIWRAPKLMISTGIYILYRYALLANVIYILAISGRLGNKVSFSLRLGTTYMLNVRYPTFSRSIVVYQTHPTHRSIQL